MGMARQTVQAQTVHKRSMHKQTDPRRLLCISNGHGEDAIAVRILQALRELDDSVELSALAMVGTGDAYHNARIPLLGPAQKMPSGGFIYMDKKRLVQDVQSGLLSLTFKQIQSARGWAAAGGAAFAVGDIIPLAMAWLCGLEYAAIGTAKSEYWLRNEAGLLENRPWYQGWAGSVYLPWERWLMAPSRCRLMVVRDRITAETLQSFSIPAQYAGNPMMDNLEPDSQKLAQLQAQLPATSVTLLLLPGSRTPECIHNWRRILFAVESVLAQYAETPVGLMAAISPGLPLADFQTALQAAGWRPHQTESPGFGYRRANGTLLLVNTAYNECLALAAAAIATAGTATEQFAGLGKPVFTLPGPGPQFTRPFAAAQAHLLGATVEVVEQPEAVGRALNACLQDRQRLENIRQIGRDRMGQPGAARRIADLLLNRLVPPRIP